MLQGESKACHGFQAGLLVEERLTFWTSSPQINWTASIEVWICIVCNAKHTPNRGERRQMEAPPRLPQQETIQARPISVSFQFCASQARLIQAQQENRQGKGDKSKWGEKKCNYAAGKSKGASAGVASLRERGGEEKNLGCKLGRWL